VWVSISKIGMIELYIDASFMLFLPLVYRRLCKTVLLPAYAKLTYRNVYIHNSGNLPVPGVYPGKKVKLTTTYPMYPSNSMPPSQRLNRLPVNKNRSTNRDIPIKTH